MSMVQPDIKCAACGFHIVSVWLPNRSAGLCGTCVEKAPALYLKEHARVAELEGWLWKVVKPIPIDDMVATKGYSWKEPALYKLLKGLGGDQPAPRPDWTETKTLPKLNCDELEGKDCRIDGKPCVPCRFPLGGTSVSQRSPPQPDPAHTCRKCGASRIIVRGLQKGCVLGDSSDADAPRFCEGFEPRQKPAPNVPIFPQSPVEPDTIRETVLELPDAGLDGNGKAGSSDDICANPECGHPQSKHTFTSAGWCHYCSGKCKKFNRRAG